MQKVVLIIPDSGPLISLARGKSLELLLALEIPVYIVDVVYEEVTSYRDFPDALEIEKFVQANANGKIHKFNTEIMEDIEARKRKTPGYRKKHAGEMAIAEMVTRLDEIANRNDPVMMIFEDDKAPRIPAIALLGRNTWILSTWSYLLGLEKKGLIPSAVNVWEKITNKEGG